MKKWPVTLLSLTLALSLPGCGKKKCEKRCDAEVETNMDVNISAKNFETEDTEDEDEDQDEDDADDFLEEEEDAVEYFANKSTDSSKEFSWIDAEENDLKTIYFAFDKSEIKEDQKIALAEDIKKIKELLREYEKTGITASVIVEGHSCHSAGTPSYNLILSQYRAEVVASELIQEGIPSHMVKVVGRGQEMSIVEGNRDEQAPNRRVEIHVNV